MQQRMIQRVGTMCLRRITQTRRVSLQTCKNMMAMRQLCNRKRVSSMTLARRYFSDENNNTTHSDFQTQWKTADTGDIKKQIEKV